MKKNISRGFAGLLAASGIFLCASQTQAANYAGNGNTGFGGPIGQGSLTLSDDGTNISGTFAKGANGFNDDLVIYIQSGAGGFTDTSGFADGNDGLRKAISGFDGGGSRSLMTFISGFTPNYAIALGPSSDNFGALWQLANGGGNSLPYVTSVNLSPTGDPNAATYTFSFPASSIGLTPGGSGSFKLFGTYISHTGYRSTEAIAGNATGTQGYSPFTQTSYVTYNFNIPIVVTYPVTFQVDMSGPVADGTFNTSLGDHVEARGSFQSNQWTAGFTLTNSPANTNIFKGTYNDPNAVGTPEQYKFYMITGGGGTTNAESTDNRAFTLTGNSPTLSLSYFSDHAPVSAPTVPLTFKVNMTYQIALGRFSPGADSIEVFGTFDSDPTFAWQPGHILTDSGVSNIYVGTVNDGNYSGTAEQYKFVIVDNTFNQRTYESINNRSFTASNSAQVFPVAFFNNVTNATPVTFQVDMTVQKNTGNFNPGNGDVVGVQGAFQFPNQWSGGFNLTNSPANTNIYSGTYIVADNPGNVDQYKFIYVNGSGTHYESLPSNRSFTVLATNSEVLPLVNFGNIDANDVLSSNTLVTFSVSMTNAVGTDAHVFNSGTDGVYLNGDFIPWWTWAPLGAPPSTNQVNPLGGGTLIYTLQLMIPAGNPLALSYKYGINGVDDEAAMDVNHVRYIRSVGNFVMPLDTFGTQTVEPVVGSLSLVANASGTHVTLHWNGRPGIHVQSATSLSNPVWTDVSNTEGLSTITLAAGGASKWYRLVKP
ncbi:MAG: type sorting protein [Pedosphaera sp.]|nr:type sorting protein [Pedosphaera sp.]